MQNIALQNPQNTALFNGLDEVDDVKPLSTEDMPFVEEFKELLKKHNKLDRFGLSLLHKHFDLAEGEILLESTDVHGRRQVIEPIRAETLPEGEAMETAWRFDTEEKFWCFAYCQSSGRGHQPQHRDIFGIGSDN